MPNKAMKLCLWPGCGRLTSGAYCEEHRQYRKQQEYRQRSHEYAYLYNDQRWRGPDGIRQRRLSNEPLCRECKRHGIIRAASECDHIIMHKGNPDIFFNYEQTQSLCESCHSAKTIKEGAFGR